MIFKVWHNLLGMEKHDRAWHEADIADELAEYEKAQGFIERWSELADIVYTYTRARWSGHARLASSLSSLQFFFGSLYMFPKYTLRWLFFRRAGRKSGAREIVREVRNPAKTEKLNGIASMYGIDEATFRDVCERQQRWWPLLK